MATLISNQEQYTAHIIVKSELVNLFSYNDVKKGHIHQSMDVFLNREPNYNHDIHGPDMWAIKVTGFNDEDIGYINPSDAIHLAPIMDFIKLYGHDADVEATISDTYDWTDLGFIFPLDICFTCEEQLVMKITKTLRNLGMDFDLYYKMS